MLEAQPADRVSDQGRAGASAFRIANVDLAYNHLGLRSLPLWRELEAVTASQVLTLTGGAAHGETEDLDLLAWLADAVGKPGRWLSPGEAAERWPGIRFAARVFFHPLAGRLDPGAAVVMLRRAAVRAGAAIRYGECAIRIDVQGENLVEIRATGRDYRARRVVIAAGPWSARLAGGLVRLPPLRVTWEQSCRFDATCANPDWPVFFQYLGPTELAIGGYPSGLCGVPGPDGIEVGFVAPGLDEADFRTESARLRALRRYACEWLPGAGPNAVTFVGRRYTVSSDFVLDRAGPVVVGTGFSGRGFPFLPAVGRTIAELAMGGHTRPTGRLATP